MVAYTVNYEDEQGNKLAESQTFYGNVGDKPVVAYRYIENYVPQALALTKTLSDNEAENVFTFKYAPGATNRVVETVNHVTVVIPGNTITNTVTVPAGTTVQPVETEPEPMEQTVRVRMELPEQTEPEQMQTVRQLRVEQMPTADRMQTRMVQ